MCQVMVHVTSSLSLQFTGFPVFLHQFEQQAECGIDLESDNHVLQFECLFEFSVGGIICPLNVKICTSFGDFHPVCSSNQC